MSTDTQVETTPLASELNKAAESLKPKHKVSKMLAPEKRKRTKTVKAKSVKAKSVKAKRKPVSGQSGPSIEALPFDALNKKEMMLLGRFSVKGEREVRTIEQLASEAFRNQSAKKANSWARNSLRRLIRSNWLEKLEPGQYRLTEAGRKRLVRADS